MSYLVPSSRSRATLAGSQYQTVKPLIWTARASRRDAHLKWMVHYEGWLGGHGLTKTKTRRSAISRLRSPS